MRRIIALTILTMGLLALPAFASDTSNELRPPRLSFKDYAATQLDSFWDVLADVMKTAKPAFLFTKGMQGHLAVEVSLEEFEHWNLVLGKYFVDNSKLYLDENGNHHWFIGGELKGLPVGPAFRNVFRYFRPGAAYDFGAKQIRFMVIYEFRSQE